MVVLNDFIIGIRTLINGMSSEYLLHSRALYECFALNWCNKKKLGFESRAQFNVRLVDRQEVPAVYKIRCLLYLGPMKTEMIFYILDCNEPCVLGIPFFLTINPTIGWVTQSIYICAASGLVPLEMINSTVQPQHNMVSVKQFERGLRKN